MSKATKAEMQRLVCRAIQKASFRAQLITSPQEAARKLKVALDDADVKELKKLTKDLNRFGSKSGHAKTDAESWSVGILQIRVVKSKKGKKGKKG